MNSTRLTPLVAFLLLASANTFAATPPPVEDVGEIVVSAHLARQPKQKVASSVDIITKKQITNSKATNVPEVLRNLAGVDVVSLGAPGEDLDIRIRGSDRDEVLVMIDGVAVNSPYDARATIINAIPLPLVEKIEVLRGSLSVLYGSDAVGGVINIITKKKPDKIDEKEFPLVNPDRPQFTASFDAGNLQTFQETFTAIGKTENSHYAGAYSRVDQRGRFENDRFSQNAFFFNFGHNFTENTKLSAFFTHLNQHQQLARDFVFGNPNPVLPIYVVRDNNRDFVRNMTVSQISLEGKPRDWYRWRASYSFFLETSNEKNPSVGDVLFDPTLPPTSAVADVTGHRHVFDLRNQIKWLDRDSLKSELTFGMNTSLEYLKYHGAEFPGENAAPYSYSYPDPTTDQKGGRYNIAGYVENTFEFKKHLFFTTGFRFDHNTTYGNAISPRVSLTGYIPQTHTKLFGSYSRGFKAPTINQYYFSLNDQTGFQLRQNISKEVSDTFEVGAEQELFDKKLKANATFFRTNFDGKINESQLIPSGHLQGVEVGLSVKPAEWLEFSSNYTFLDTKDDLRNAPLANRPKHRFNLGLNVKPILRLTLHADFEATSSRIIPTILSTEQFGDFEFATFDTNGNLIAGSLPATYLVNVAARYEQHLQSRWIRQLNYSFRIRNLLNRENQERAGFSSPKLTFLAGVQAEF